MSKYQAMKRAQAQQSNPAIKTTSKASTNNQLISQTVNQSTDLSTLCSEYPMPTIPIGQSLSQSISQSNELKKFTAYVSDRDLPVPSGYINGDFSDDQSTKQTVNQSKQGDLLYQSALNTGLAPGKQLLMTAFMLWMSGNSLQIFSIMMLGMAFFQPLTKMFNVNQEFQRFESKAIDHSVNLTIPKLVFVASNMAGVCLALYKCQSMGLLPTSAADWLPSDVRHNYDFSGGQVSW